MDPRTWKLGHGNVVQSFEVSLISKKALVARRHVLSLGDPLSLHWSARFGLRVKPMRAECSADGNPSRIFLPRAVKFVIEEDQLGH